MKSNSMSNTCKLLILTSGATALAMAFVSPLFPGGNRAVAQENDPDPVPQVEATASPTCNPDAPWTTVGTRPSINITEYRCEDGTYTPIYESSGSYSQESGNPCNPTRECNVTWSHVGPIPIQETQTNPETGESEEVVTGYKYTFTESDSCGNAQTIAPVTMPVQCCPQAPGQ